MKAGNRRCSDVIPVTCSQADFWRARAARILPLYGASPKTSIDSRNLDFLRTVAVLCVFVTHLINYLSGTGQADVRGIPFHLLGQTGVLLFFVHTALVLMMSMERMTSRNLVTNFYVRRFFRIYPLSVACIGAVLLFHIPWGFTFSPFSWKEIVASLFLVQNLFPTYRSISAPLWSLPFEVQMYLMLPAIFFLLKRVPSKLTVLLLWVAVCGAQPFAPLLLEYAPCFLGGVLAYQLAKERTFALPGWVLPTSMFALFVLYVLLKFTVLPDSRSDYLLCMFLGGIIPNVTEFKRSRLTRACHVLAKYSYGIYLGHALVFWLCFVKLSFLPIAAQLLLMIPLMFVVPFAAYKLIETPFIAIGRRFTSQKELQHASHRRQFAAPPPLLPRSP